MNESEMTIGPIDAKVEGLSNLVPDQMTARAVTTTEEMIKWLDKQTLRRGYIQQDRDMIDKIREFIAVRMAA